MLGMWGIVCADTIIEYEWNEKLVKRIYDFRPQFFRYLVDSGLGWWKDP